MNRLVEWNILAGMLLAFLFSMKASAATVTFEGDGSADRFVLDGVSAYQPNPYDSPNDGADNLAAYTESDWVGINTGGASVSNLFWDGGLDGGTNSALNLLLPDTFALQEFLVVGVYASQTLTVRGLNNDGLRYEQNIFIDASPVRFQVSWTGIDQLQFITGDDITPYPDYMGVSTYGYWAIDNLVYNSSVSEVPVPPAMGLLASGWVFLVGLGRRIGRG